MRSKIDPMKKVAKTLRSKKELILNWFRDEGTLSSGAVEGLNNKLKLITRRSYGFKAQEAYEIALYHNLGDLPFPEMPHRFFCRGKMIRFYHDDLSGQIVRIDMTYVKYDTVLA